jgi:hypothetical protein
MHLVSNAAEICPMRKIKETQISLITHSAQGYRRKWEQQTERISI